MDAKNAKGFTPLQMAWNKGDMEMVKVLVNAGADVNVRDGHGLTLLMRAAREKRDAGLEVVKALLAADALLDCKCARPCKVPGVADVPTCICLHF